MHRFICFTFSVEYLIYDLSISWCIVSYGVISAPEVTDWQPLTDNDCYLVAASDGVFEKLSSQDVCDILWNLHADFSVQSELTYSCSYSLADCIVNAAFEKGSMDNMAAVILPVRLNDSMQTAVKKTHGRMRKFDCSSLGDSKYISQHSGKIECSSSFYSWDHE